MVLQLVHLQNMNLWSKLYIKEKFLHLMMKWKIFKLITQIWFLIVSQYWSLQMTKYRANNRVNATSFVIIFA